MTKVIPILKELIIFFKCYHDYNGRYFCYIPFALLKINNRKIKEKAEKKTRRLYKRAVEFYIASIIRILKVETKIRAERIILTQ